VATNPTTKAEAPRRRLLRAGSGFVALFVVVAGLAFSVGPVDEVGAASSTSKKKTLATLRVKSPAVEIKKNGKTAFVTAKNNQVLRKGDALRTDATGGAEIAYTDGSLTRLGPSTEFAITKLSEKQGVRKTEGTLSVGSTWNRAAEVSESGSFEIKAGGATAAVEGTAFSVILTIVNGVPSVEIIDVDDNVSVTLDTGAVVALVEGARIVVTGGVAGPVQILTYDQLSGNLFIAGNLLLDEQLGIGGLADLGTPPTTTTAPPEGGGGGDGGGGGGGEGEGAAVQGEGPTVTVEGTDVGSAQYPPDGEIIVDDPNVEPGGEVVFRGSGCAPNETLSVLWDGKQVGTIPSDADGNFAGSLMVPITTAPGPHTLTIRGSACELSITINVLGARLALTGTSNTGTFVMVGVTAVVIGLALAVGARRRRTSAGHSSSRGGPSTA
jgi:LPXTG-motif cell wall-anchored protein